MLTWNYVVIYHSSKQCSIISLKILNMDLWNVAGALQSPNDILLNANVPKGHVNVVFSWSSSAIGIW